MNSKKFILWFAQEHINFRNAEINSILKLKNILMKHLQHNNDYPYWIVELPDDEAAIQLASRSVLLKYVLEYWGHSSNITCLHQSISKYITEHKEYVGTLFDASKSFKIEVETYNKKITQSDKVEKIENFSYLPIKGNVNLKCPETTWYYFEFYGLDLLNVPNEPECVLFGKLIANGQRSLIKELSLKNRKFIGNTSMDAQLSLLMANNALVNDGDLVMDPFVGSGSLLIAAAKFGGYTLGSDIDFLMLHGRTKPSRITQKIREYDECVEANFKQYGCAKNYIDTLVSDFSLKIWRDEIKFDSIITDPPYGIREATEKVESKVKSRAKNQEKIDQPHYPSTSVYNLNELFIDLLNFSFRHLKIGGRLVCWIPFFRSDYAEELVPKHSCFKVISNSEQVLSNLTVRRLLTYEKISEAIVENDVKLPQNISPTIDFRDKYFYHGEESRKERRIQRAKLREQGRHEALKRGKVLNADGKVVKPESHSKACD